MPNLELPPGFPEDSATYIDEGFTLWLQEHVTPPISGTNALKEVYISRETLEGLLADQGQRMCVGVVFYLTYVPVSDTSTGQTKVQATLAAIGVDSNGQMIDKSDGPVFLTKPCPPYCPSWR